MDISITSDTRNGSGQRVVVFSVTENARTEEFTATVFGKRINSFGHLTIDAKLEWTSANPVVVLHQKEDFVFPRGAATGTQIVTDGNGDALMDNDVVAPKYTVGTATQHLLATNNTLKLLKELADNHAADAGVTDALAALQTELVAPLVGTQYLTARRTWKTESVKALTPAEMLNTVARAGWRKMLAIEAAAALDNGDFDAMDPTP